MKVETIGYSVSGLSCHGQLVYDETIRTRRPLLLVAPNWLGIIPPVLEVAKMLASDRYIVFVADMYGEGGKPTGKENPMEFLAPLMKNAAETRKRVVAAFDTLVREAEKRDIGDTKRRAAIGYCFGGANVLDLARAGADVAAVVSMHGTFATSMPAKRGEVKAAVLAVHGAADPIAPKAERDGLEKEMDAAGVSWVMLNYGGVVHAFTDEPANMPGVAVYYEPATRQGYQLAHTFIADAFAGKLTAAQR
ncbi:MAG TPA: dienelactone hydrolase family protein [Stellaceae bacterium]|nr:dienelactone hydrolase family protein [Stellaceae bacterium]